MTPDAPAPAAATTAPLSLATMLCFDLYSASRAMTAVYRPLLDPFDLTYPQYLVLVALWTQGDSSVRQVVDTLRLDYGTVSPLLKRLEARGLVERHRRADDERSVTVTLTDDGRALRERLAHVPEHVGRALGLGTEDQTTFARLLAAVTRSALQHTAAQPATT